ncbi:hypothetical protein [Flagellimonas sp. 2504JD4-2]
MKIAIYILSFLLIVITLESPFCSCNQNESLESEIQKSELVAIGEVTEKKIISKNLDNKEGNLLFMGYKVRVIKSFKGIKKDRTIYVYTTSNTASCGIQLETNKKYILFGDKGTFLPERFHSALSDMERLSYWINHCSKTQIYNHNLEKEIDSVMTY